MQAKRTPAANDNPTKRFIEFLPGLAQALHVASLRPIVQLHFFTHVLVFASYFMSVSFWHSAFVFGGPAENAGAVTAKSRPATIAVPRIFDIMGFLVLGLVFSREPLKVRSAYCSRMSGTLRFCKMESLGIKRRKIKASPTSGTITESVNREQS